MSCGYDIKVKVNNDIVTNYTYTNNGLIKFNSFNFKNNDASEIEAPQTGLISKEVL